MWSYAWLLVVAFAAMVWVTWTTVRGAPWSPTPMSTVRQMLEMAEVGADDVVYDLGCGDGRLIVTAARRYEARAVASLSGGMAGSTYRSAIGWTRSSANTSASIASGESSWTCASSLATSPSNICRASAE